MFDRIINVNSFEGCRAEKCVIIGACELDWASENLRDKIRIISKKLS